MLSFLLNNIEEYIDNGIELIKLKTKNLVNIKILGFVNNNNDQKNKTKLAHKYINNVKITKLKNTISQCISFIYLFIIFIYHNKYVKKIEK